MSEKPEVLIWTGLFVVVLRTVLLVGLGIAMHAWPNGAGVLCVAVIPVAAIGEWWVYECWKSRP